MDADSHEGDTGESPKLPHGRASIGAAPEDFLYHLYRGRELLQDNCVELAREELEHAVRLEQHDVEARSLLSVAYYRLGLHARAIELYGQIVHQRPELRGFANAMPESAQAASADAAHETLRGVAADAEIGLDAAPSDLPFARLDRGPREAAAGRWQTREPGQALQPPRLGHWRDPYAASRYAVAAPLTPEAALAAAVSPEAFVEGRRVSSVPGRAGRTPEGLVFLQVGPSVAVRGERVRALSPNGEGLKPLALKRRMRGRETNEPFGTPGSSWLGLEGSGLVLLEAAPDRELALVELGGEFVYIREARLVAFELSARYENGRLPAADPGPVPMVQLAGDGLLVFEVRATLRTLRVTAERPVTVRAASVLGWTGRLLGQAVPVSHSPSLGAGFVAFSGDGAVLVDDP